MKSSDLTVSKWEIVLGDALHSIRSLLCTSTGQTPHERFFKFARRSSHGKSLPDWLINPGPVFLRKFVRSGKNDDLVVKVDLLESNPMYARIRYPDGRESNVSLRDLAPFYESSGMTRSSSANRASDVSSDIDEVSDHESGNHDTNVVTPPAKLSMNDDLFAEDDMSEEFLGFPSTDNDFVPSHCIPSADFCNSSESPSTNENNVVSTDQYTPRRSSRLNKGEPPLRYNVSSF